jgi:MFS family permease
MLFAASLLAFPAVTTPGAAAAFAVALGASGGVITVVFFTAHGHAFGRTHLGHVQAAVQVLSVFASAAGPVLLTSCREWTGSYHGLFFASAPAAALLGVWAWLVRVPRAVPPEEALRP